MENNINKRYKSFTSLEQSKKLAEILPLESADMIYIPMMDIDSMSNSGFFDIPECYPFNEFKDSDTKPLPCWSLAALLDALPKEQHPELMMNAHYKWICNINNPSSFSYKPTVGNNPLDAIFEMIIKLHELKML